MRPRRFLQSLCVACGFLVLLHNGCVHQDSSSDISSLDQPQLSPADDPGGLVSPNLGTQAPPALPEFPASEYLLATGRGDLNRGTSICLRTADMAARAELAKLIRVRVKEHSTDHIRERTSRSLEQDIEVIREEQADQLLQEVRIVHRTVDKTGGTCSSIAVMPKGATVTPPPSSPSNTGNTAQKPAPSNTPLASPQ